MARNYLIFLIVAGVLASMAGNMGMRDGPAASAPAVERSSGRHGQMTAAAEATGPSLMASDELVLDRESDGHFYADVEVNGQSLRVLVDTGASGIALSRDDARRAGLGVSIGLNEIVGQGASGDVRGEHVMLDRIRLGSVEVQQTPAVVLASGGQSLLGQTFLAKFHSVEIRGDRMYLRA
jgi:aspartyl protease family protein